MNRVHTHDHALAGTWWLGAAIITAAAALGVWLGWPSEVTVGHDPSNPAAAAISASVVHGAAPRAPVRLEIASEPPGAELFVDGVYVGRTPARRVEVHPDATGHVELELRHRRLDAPLVRTVRVGPDTQRGRLTIPLIPTD